MHRPTTRALTGTAEHPRLSFQRTYRTSPENLRGALTDVHRLSRWLGRIDGAPAAVGDPFTVQLSDDPEDAATGRVLTCEENLVRVTWVWQGEAESVITVQVLPLDDGTATLQFDHALREPEHVAGYGGGWEQVLQSLARALKTTDVDAPSDEQIETEAVGVWQNLIRGAITIERRLPAAVDRVWTAIASSDGLRTWWWNHWDDVTIETDVRPGGSYRITAPRIGVVLTGTYLEVEEPTCLSVTWVWREESGEALDEAVDIRLAPIDDGSTLLTVRHTGPWAPGDELASDYRTGWEDTLDSLGRRLSR